MPPPMATEPHPQPPVSDEDEDELGLGDFVVGVGFGLKLSVPAVALGWAWQDEWANEHGQMLAAFAVLLLAAYLASDALAQGWRGLFAPTSPPSARAGTGSSALPEGWSAGALAKEPPPTYTLTTLLVATAVAVVVTDIETDIEGCLRYLGADEDSPQAPVAVAENGSSAPGGTFALGGGWGFSSLEPQKKFALAIVLSLLLSLLPSAEELAEEKRSLASFDLHAGSTVKLSLRTVPPRRKRRLQNTQEARRIPSMWPEGTAALSVGTVTLQQTVKEKDGA